MQRNQDPGNLYCPEERERERRNRKPNQSDVRTYIRIPGTSRVVRARTRGLYEKEERGKRERERVKESARWAGACTDAGNQGSR